MHQPRSVLALVSPFRSCHAIVIVLLLGLFVVPALMGLADYQRLLPSVMASEGPTDTCIVTRLDPTFYDVEVIGFNVTFNSTTDPTRAWMLSFYNTSMPFDADT